MTSENLVLSAVVKNKDVHAILGEDSEIFGAHADVFQFVKEYYLRYKSVPSESVIGQKFPDVEIVDTDAPTKYYMESLRNEFVASRVSSIIAKADDAITRGVAMKTVLDKLSTAVASLGKYSNSARDVNIVDIEYAKEHFSKQKEVADLKGGTPGISTGIKSIDSSYTTGMAPGHSIVLMGYTARGKSYWAADLAVAAWRQGFKPMIISLEMSPEEQMERIYAIMAKGRFKISDLARGNVSIDDVDAWGKKEFEDASEFVIVSNEGISEMTPNIVQSKIDTHRPDIVFLDYLQLMKDNAKTQQMTQRMLNLSREVKMLAVSNAIPVVSITAVTDEDGEKRTGPPRLNQIAWSSGIEYDANLAIAVHRHDDSKVVQLTGRKNRHGDLFNCYIDVDFDRGIVQENFSL